MLSTESTIAYLPLEYWLCVVLIAVSCLMGLRHRDKLWIPSFLAVLATVAGWYMVEPLYFEDFFGQFVESSVATAFRCVLVFLMTLIVAAPLMTRALRPKAELVERDLVSMTPEQLIPVIVPIWFGLLLFGIYRMEGDVLATLFPLLGRTDSTMWQRAAGEDAGPTGFLVSASAYVYVLLLSLFGLLLPITQKPKYRWVLIICIFISWPYAILQGSRNITLAVITPMIAAYLLLSRRPVLMKVVVAVLAFAAVDLLMRMIIGFRDVGFAGASLREIEEARHSGLNMASELVNITEILERGVLSIGYGKGYFDEILNVIPRAIWPEKPYIGIEYAIARGFGGGQSDIGVFATLSTGVIGQGVLEFGVWFGPMFAGLLMATWVGFLTRLRAQGGAARIGLFLIGLGLTFNLGRGLTLLTLFPLVFGYVGVVLLERRAMRRKREAEVVNRRLEAANTRVYDARAGLES
jgi:oligosaccharide repeat unit polymerase